MSVITYVLFPDLMSMPIYYGKNWDNQYWQLKTEQGDGPVKISKAICIWMLYRRFIEKEI